MADLSIRLLPRIPYKYILQNTRNITKHNGDYFINTDGWLIIEIFVFEGQTNTSYSWYEKQIQRYAD